MKRQCFILNYCYFLYSCKKRNFFKCLRKSSYENNNNKKQPEPENQSSTIFIKSPDSDIFIRQCFDHVLCSVIYLSVSAWTWPRQWPVWPLVVMLVYNICYLPWVYNINSNMVRLSCLHDKLLVFLRGTTVSEIAAQIEITAF